MIQKLKIFGTLFNIFIVFGTLFNKNEILVKYNVIQTSYFITLENTDISSL